MMPVYIYKCPNHGYYEEYRQRIGARESVVCSRCGQIMARSYHKEQAGLPPFRSYWTEALSPEPVFVDSREQQAALCKKIDVERVS